MKPLFDCNEQLMVCNSLVNTCNDISKKFNVADDDVFHGLLAATAIWAFHTYNKKQLNIFVEGDKQEILNRFSEMIDDLASNKGQPLTELPN